MAEQKEEKHIDDIIRDIIKEDRKALGLETTSGYMHLNECEQDKADAREGYLIGQLVHRAFVNGQLGLTFDDVTGSPHRALKSRQDADLTTTIAEGIDLNIPIISTDMKDVTGYKMAIAMAQIGGLGVIHRFCSPEQQALEVYKVKTSPTELPSGVVKELGRTYTPALSKKDKTLLAAASIGINEKDDERVKRLIDAGVDVLFPTVAHAHSGTMEDYLKKLDELIRHVDKLKNNYPKIPLIPGNVATPKAVYDLIQAGADGIRGPISYGFACTTSNATGAGVPPLTAIYDMFLVAKKYGSGVIADGGIRHAGDVVKLLAAGAVAGMSGKLLAATHLSNNLDSRVVGEMGEDGNPLFVKYRGSASEPSKREQGRPVFDASEGDTRILPYEGDTYKVLAHIITRIQSGFSYAGNRKDGDGKPPNISRLQEYSRWLRQNPVALNK